MRKRVPPIALLFSLLPGITAQAALVDRGGGLLYDDVLNVTWIQDQSLPVTMGVHPTGYMTWTEAMLFASELVYPDPLRGTVWDDWRLPSAYTLGTTSVQVNTSTNRTELGHLWDSGGFAYFTNLGSTVHNWTSTQRDADLVYVFNEAYTSHYYTVKDPVYRPEGIWLLRDGDVGPIPEPGVALLAVCCMPLALRRRRS